MTHYVNDSKSSFSSYYAAFLLHKTVSICFVGKSRQRERKRLAIKLHPGSGSTTKPHPSYKQRAVRCYQSGGGVNNHNFEKLSSDPDASSSSSQ